MDSLIRTAYGYFAALGSHVPASPSGFCGCGHGRKKVCAQCGGRWLAAAYRAAEIPEKASRGAFLEDLLKAGNEDASGITKAAVLGSVLKVVGDVLREWHRENSVEYPGGGERISLLGRNPFLRPAPELCADHVGECAILVLTSGFPLARGRSDLWAASRLGLGWACDYQGGDHYGYADWLKVQRETTLPGRVRDAEEALCLGLSQGVDSGGRVDAHWLCDAALPAGVDPLPILLGSELVNFGILGDVESDCDEFARSVVARLGVMIICSSVDIVDEAMCGERNLLDTLCGSGARGAVGWAVERIRDDTWSPAETDAWALWSHYVWLGQRHRFVFRGMPERTQAALATSWKDSDTLPALLRTQREYLSIVVPDPELLVACDCCDHVALAREMTAWLMAANGSVDVRDKGQLAFLKLVDACGINECDTWHRSILDLCPSLRERHRVLLRSLVRDVRKFTAGLDHYVAYLKGADCRFLPVRPQWIAHEASADLCAKHHGYLMRAARSERLEPAVCR
ncbi:hypothetical protein ACIGJO_22205 [Streptomyces sp. NPDC079020]|uniref:hypothetical protein n=1 Tax=Streptomyces sp. NPDC079020 TaxID=3365722 RepID=UPI0037D0B03B